MCVWGPEEIIEIIQGEIVDIARNDKSPRVRAAASRLLTLYPLLGYREYR